MTARDVDAVLGQGGDQESPSPTRARCRSQQRRCFGRRGTCSALTRKELALLDEANGVEFFYLRPRDIAVYVGEGTLDVGITGRDMLLDSHANADRGHAARVRPQPLQVRRTSRQRLGGGKASRSAAGDVLSGTGRRVSGCARRQRRD